jgi:hypothetical protein
VRFIDPRASAFWRWAALLVCVALASCAEPDAAPRPPGFAFHGAPRTPLAAPNATRSWDEFKRQAAHRMVAAAPVDATYAGPVPSVLLAIPVLEVELNRDGSVDTIKVLRYPTQAKDTTQMAVDAVRRAGPYGDVSRLPRPWKFVEVFLFDDDRRFKPRTLDE